MQHPLRHACLAAMMTGLLAGSIAPVRSGASSPSPDARALLAQMYSAMGGEAWDHLVGAEFSGDYDFGGLKGSFRQLIDFVGGRDVFSFDVGTTRGAQGVAFDRSWWVDEKGLPTIEEAPEALADAATESFEDRNGWFQPGPEVPVSFAGTRTEQGHNFELVRMLPPQGRELTLWIDASTHRLDRVSEIDAEQQPFISYFSDYRQIEGVWLAFQQRESTGEPSNDVTMRINHVQLRAHLADADFDPPDALIRDARLLDAAASSSIPFTLQHGLIIVQVSIEDQKTLPFALDSGALNLLTPAAAYELGLTSTGNVAVNGIGSRQITSHLAQIRHYRIGGAQLDDQQFVVLPLPTPIIERGRLPPLAGLIGYELFRRFQVTIDYQHHRLTLALPTAPLTGERLPLFFDGRRSFIKAAVDGVPGYFGLDTGDNGPLTLFDPFYVAHDFPIEYPGIQGNEGGVGGSVRTLLTRIDSLALGSLTLLRPLTALNFAKSGAFAAQRIAGNLGSQVFQNFVLTFDYAHHMLAVRKSADFGYSMAYDRSGMHLNVNRAGVIYIESIDPSSPADQAGLQTGDRLLGVDHQQIGSDYFDLQTELSGPPGTRLQLTLLRGSRLLKVSLTLRELLPVDAPLQRAPRAMHAARVSGHLGRGFDRRDGNAQAAATPN